jgi:thiol-disulfide isomerase/thioredoxin
MKRLFALLACSTLTVAAVAACSGGKDAVDQGAGGQFRYHDVTAHGKAIAPADRKAVGKVSGDLLGGGPFSLAEQKGKVVVLNFWGSWCGPCQVESPQFDSLYRTVKGQGVEFVGLDVKETTRSKPESFIKDNQITYPNVWDPKAKTAIQLGKVPMVGLPWTVIVDKQQRVAAVYSGPVQPADLRPVLTQLVAER